MDLPIDHFRLLGVSPSAAPEAILRRLEARCDSPPDQGFTHEVLLLRADLLRRSADLLSDPADRAEYEAALLRLSESHPNGTVGLDLPTSSEVAGLMLLWEANGALEAFQLARQGLQPPQAPALGSGREADLTLLAALACRDAAVEEQDQRRYESAAQLLIDGIELQQRMGKLPDQQRQLEDALQGLTPFRILDLLSRDLGDQDSHQRGLTLLDELVVARGGLEASDADGDQPGSLSQEDFESFFHQIRRFLTVQEQIDLFSRWFEGVQPMPVSSRFWRSPQQGSRGASLSSSSRPATGCRRLPMQTSIPCRCLAAWICCWATSRMRIDISPSCGIRICRLGF